jgi:hypothetical protein
MPVYKGLHGPPMPTSQSDEAWMIADSKNATDLERRCLAIIVAIVPGLVSCSIGKVSSICQESRASLDGRERGLK